MLIIPTIVTALTKIPNKPGILSWVRWLLSIISLAKFDNDPGTAKLPFIASGPKPPPTNGVPPMPPPTLVALLLLALAAAGCAHGRYACPTGAITCAATALTDAAKITMIIVDGVKDKHPTARSIIKATVKASGAAEDAALVCSAPENQCKWVPDPVAGTSALAPAPPLKPTTP